MFLISGKLLNRFSRYFQPSPPLTARSKSPMHSQIYSCDRRTIRKLARLAHWLPIDQVYKGIKMSSLAERIVNLIIRKFLSDNSHQIFSIKKYAHHTTVPKNLSIYKLGNLEEKYYCIYDSFEQISLLIC